MRTDLPGINDFPQKPASIPAHAHVHIMMDRASLTTAYPRIVFSGGKGEQVVITYSEALYDKDQKKGNRNDVGDRQALGITDSMLPDGGAHRYSSRSGGAHGDTSISISRYGRPTDSRKFPGLFHCVSIFTTRRVQLQRSGPEKDLGHWLAYYTTRLS